MKDMRKKLHALAGDMRAAARGLRPKLSAFWNRFGYVTSMAALLLLVGAAATIYRSRAAQNSAPAPTPTPQPALASSLNVGAEAEAEEPSFLPPLDGEVVGKYRPDALVWSDTLGLWQTHAALDIAAPLGTAVAACADGTVSEAYRDPLLGYTVRIEHEGGYESLYACLQSAEMVKAGQSVKMGEVIGAVGESADAEAELGAHLHFAFFHDGTALQPPLESA